MGPVPINKHEAMMDITKQSKVKVQAHKSNIAANFAVLNTLGVTSEDVVQQRAILRGQTNMDERAILTKRVEEA